jgi:hypothetical protein
MTHWGWYWKVKKKHRARLLCSSLTSIDSFKLYKGNKLAGFSVQPFEIRAMLAEDCLRVTYRKRKDIPYVIPIDRQPCNYGGFRYFFKCPFCQKRMRKLYLVQQSMFLCRKCINAAYYSQRIRPTDRFALMCMDIEKYIKSRGGNLELNEKPPRMHQKTFQKLKDRKAYYDAKSGQELYKEIRRWRGPKAERWLDGYFEFEWEMDIERYKEKYMKNKGRKHSEKDHYEYPKSIAA